MKPRDISEIDRNFKIASVGELDVEFRDALQPPFAAEGFRRLTASSNAFRLS